MSATTADARPIALPPAALFAVTVFASAALVFMVEPMVAKLVLPLLGGGPSIWNTSLAFFQIALLAGYGYAHLVQRLRSVRAQALTHAAVMLLAALALPLRVNELFGAPSSEHPIVWLLGVLAVSIGAPFAVLSATAPLVQAWYARTLGARLGREPYVLYAASNLGSLLALLAYPALVEPSLTVTAQRLSWSAAYLAFAVLMASLGFVVSRSAGPAVEAEAASPAAPVRWGDRLAWVGLAAIPSSLMLGVTEHITTDIASAPFLWVLPLALYLLTFVIAFQAKPAISPGITRVLQALAVVDCLAITPFLGMPLLIELVVHIGAFFFTALMCHQALVRRRPDPARLTEFYLWMSVGGVVGGAFNAFLAPVIFDQVWEYPLAMVLSALARPWPDGKVPAQSWVWVGMGMICALAAPMIVVARHHFPQVGQENLEQVALIGVLAAAGLAAFMVRDRAPLFLVALAALAVGANGATERARDRVTWRSFFGVLKLSETNATALGRIRMLAHGTTLHGAEALAPGLRCKPLVYYTPGTPIGQVFLEREAERPSLRIGAVGLGTGSVAAYVRPGDHLTFFEIDPLVKRISSDPRYFGYISSCAKGPVDYVLGDARLTLAGQPAGAFDILLIDAFSSDAVPTHLLTVEAIRSYLDHLKPDGVLILHLSNRHLDLLGPAQATAPAAGGYELVQKRRIRGRQGAVWEADEDAVIIGKSPQALAKFAADPRWFPPNPHLVRPWTDDYVNLPGALWRRLTHPEVRAR